MTAAVLLKEYWWVLLIVAALVAQQSFKGFRNRGVAGRDAGEPPCKLRPYLMSKAERSFFSVLEEAADLSTYHVFPQVPLASLVTVESGTGAYRAYRNRIDRKTVDFVLSDRNAISPVLAIELDDFSRKRGDRRERDVSVDSVLAGANLPILHVKAGTDYDPKQLAESIRAAIIGKDAPAVK